MKTPFFLLCSLILFTFSGCDISKSEDEKIADILVGKWLEEEPTSKDIRIYDVENRYYKGGKFFSTAKMEISLLTADNERNPIVSFEIEGTWSVRDRFINYTYDKESLKIQPEIADILLKEMILKSIEKEGESSSDYIVEYNKQNIVYETSSGETRTLKKAD
jgi:hypothetical protein